MSLLSYISQRKTFAIISHPDAGKTTLTEKFLLFGGAIQVAGAVKSNKIKKHATSDFLEIERQRGISVATSVMSFNYRGYLLNLLDTPGHKDFAEDTYRTLSAVDSVILVIDSVKGVEEQTLRLMEVCRMRATPIIIFINKLDRDGKNPYSLMEEIEKTLKINTHPITFPVGIGKDFKGVFNLKEDSMLCFHPHYRPELSDKIVFSKKNIADFELRFGAIYTKELLENRELIHGVEGELNIEDYLAAKVAPVFFGSAVNNFGIQELLDTFISIAPSPKQSLSNLGPIESTDPQFSGFIFKIHANIDPRHRDRIAFMRVCSGVFQRNQFYHHVRLNKKIRFTNPYTFMAREKNILDEAYAGDIVGLFDSGNFKIGDTLTMGKHFYFTGIPNFSPEIFKTVINHSPIKSKQLHKGLNELTNEGLAQLFTMSGSNDKIIGCVGELQFEVIQHRLIHEYGAQCSFQSLPFYKACWLNEQKPGLIDEFIRYKTRNIAIDKDGKYVYLAESEWFLDNEINNNPEISFSFTNEVIS